MQLHESRELRRAEESRAASSTSFRDVVEVHNSELREQNRIYRAHEELLGLRMNPPPAPKPGQEVPVAGRGGVKVPPPWCGDHSQGTVHAIRFIEPALNLAEEPRSVAMLRDSHERMNDNGGCTGLPWKFCV